MTLRLLRCVVLVVVLTLYGATAYSRSGRPVILNWTETAQPNDAIGLQGANFGSAPQVWLTRVSGDEQSIAPNIRLPVLTRSNIFVAARIPTTIASGLYAVWIRNAGQQSKPVWINRARLTGYEFSQIAPATTFRIWGRNLAFGGTKSRVWFTNSQTGERMAGTVLNSDQYILTVLAPSNL